MESTPSFVAINAAPFEEAAIVAAMFAGAFVAFRCGFALARLRPALWRVPDRPGRAAITFDDGPDPANTEGVLEDLAAANVKATFFVLGERVVANERLVRAMAASGHDIEVHGWRHRFTLRQRSATLCRELADATFAIERITSVKPVLYRPPFGMLSPAASRAARAHGLQPYLWSAWARDWRKRRPTDMLASLTSGLKPGAVFLLHDGEGTGGTPGAVQNMRPALRQFLVASREAGYALEPLRSLLGSS
ncbi:MAG: polysaccharide deacetylase family protein [Planctomycetes bacterium]|nr:polysaccharide deacetylase family protein [Planctomycetota bacterium]MBI3844629.1 polysaccharide deacetylase family protein [Planctomycetota bacterium]